MTYDVKVEYIVVPQGAEEEVKSAPLSGKFTTKPLPPTNLKIVADSNSISWTKSPTPSVSLYKVKYRSVEEGSQAEDVLVPLTQHSDLETQSSVVLQVEDVEILNIFITNIFNRTWCRGCSTR